MNEISVWKFNKLQRLESLSNQYVDILNTSLDHVTSTLPTSAYTTFRTFNHTQVFHLEEHIHRIRNTCALENQNLEFSDEELRGILREVVHQLPQNDYRIRILVPIQFHANEGYILTETLVPYPPSYNLKGIRVVTVKMTRKRPKAKISTIIRETADLKDDLLKQYQEIILVDGNGDMLEGLSSNFFAFNADILYTARSGILEGITRKTILEVIEKTKIPLRLKPINISKLPSIQEAFISSSSRGVFPVIQIDKTIIANGLPGETTKTISKLYRDKLESALLPI